MIDTLFGIKVRMSGLCINRPIIGWLLDAGLLPYWCISTAIHITCHINVIYGILHVLLLYYFKWPLN